ncbi:MAG: DUF4238 domain-containing protein [Desulfobaccales bacterium]
MKINNIAKIQHYVPQFLLKQFSFGKNSQVWVFDKKTGGKFKSHIKNVASENGFYNFQFEEGEYTIEPSLSEIETHASKIIKDIVRKNSIADLSDEDRLFLSHFFALQFVRTKQFRQLFKDLSEIIKNTFDTRGEDISKIKDYIELDDNTVKLHGIRSLLRSGEYAPYFLDKSWILFRTTKSQPLYISDNPVTLQNMIDHGPYGNIGLAVKGIEIYFPLSDTLSLGMFCSSHEREFRKTYDKYKMLMGINPSLASQLIKDSLFITQLMEGFEKRNTVPYRVESVINHNSLQVYYASRFIFSGKGDFSLAEEMIRENPKIKDGPKIIAS